MQQHLRPPACRQLRTGHMCAASTVHRSHSFCKSPSRLTAGFTRLLQQHTASEQHTAIEDQAGPANSRSNSRTLPVEADQPTLQQDQDQEQQQQQQQQQQQHQHQHQQPLMLLQAAEQLASQLKPQQASLVLYVCAKCQLQCSQQLLHGLLQQLPPDQLQRLPPAGLVNAVWALAVLRINPGDDWMRALYDASSASSGTYSSSNGTHSSGSSSSHSRDCADSPSSNGGDECCTPAVSASINLHQCVQLIWAAGRLRVRPPPTWLSGLLSSLQPQLQALSSTELTNIIWALAQMGFRPGKNWMQAWFVASKDALLHSSADCLACQVASLGVLRLDPSTGSWLSGLRAAVAQQLSTMRSHHIAAILCGLAKRRSPTPPHWLRLVLKQQLRLLGHTDGTGSSSSSGSGEGGGSRGGSLGRSAADIAATVWSLPLLLYPSAAEWAAEPDNAVMLRQLVTISLPLLPNCTVGELVQLAVGFARLGYYPGAHWLKMHENAVAQHRLSLTDSNRVRLQAAVRRLWKDT